MTFFSLIATAFSCILYGIIATAVTMAVLYALIKAMSGDYGHTPLFYAMGVILAILLFTQFSLMSGAVKAKNTADAAEQFLRQHVERYSGIVSSQESRQILEALTDEYPIIAYYVNMADYSVQDIQTLPQTLHATITDSVRSYIWRRVWWIMGITVTICAITMKWGLDNTAKQDDYLCNRYTSGHHYHGRSTKF